MKIRMMNDEDLDHVTDLWDQHVAEVGGAAFDEESRMRIFSGLCRCLPALVSVCYVAEVDGQVVGFVVGALTESPLWAGKAGDIEELYVQPTHRRNGIGSALVMSISEWLRGKGAGVLRVNAALDSPEAIAFWKAMGWENDLTTFTRYE